MSRSPPRPGDTPAEQKNITIQHYLAGHMIYIRTQPRQKLHRDFVAFVHSLAGEGGGAECGANCK